MAVKTIIGRGGARARRKPGFAPTAATVLLLSASQLIPAPVQVATATITPDRVLAASQPVPAPVQVATVTVQPSLFASQAVRAPVQRATVSHPSTSASQLVPPPVQVATLTSVDHVYVAQIIPAPLQQAFLHLPALPVQVATLTSTNDAHVAQALSPPVQRATVVHGTAAPLPAPIADGPFFVCTAGPADTTFGPQFLFNSFDFVKAIINHKEGQKPTLTLTVRNPRSSLVSANSQVWLWFSWQDTQGKLGTPGTVYPIFYGHLIMVPIGLIGETIDLQYLADPNDVVQQKQAVAEGLKVAPFYDGVFLSDAQRDDPDAILEARTESYHYPRLALPNSVSVSDWIIGEDGTVVFADVPYVGLNEKPDRPPLLAVRVEASVAWSQVTSGTVKVGDFLIATYCGKSLIGSWPEVGKSAGGGWSMHSGFAFDIWGVETATVVTYSYNYQNTAPQHSLGDTMSVNASISWPTLSGPGSSFQVYSLRQIGIVQPDLGVNIPASFKESIIYLPLYGVAASMTLHYDANRKFSEAVNFTLLADVQPVLVQTAASQAQIETELISIKGADVGVPLPNILDWTSIQGAAVGLGQVIYPDNPAVAGGQSYQVYITPGTAGETEPTFSDVVGDLTTDGTAVAASMGAAATLEPQPWSPFLQVPAGLIIAPNFPDFVNYNDLVDFGKSQFPKVGTAITFGTIVQAAGGFWCCTEDGTTNPFGGGPPSDGSVGWTFIGASLPNGTVAFLCTQGGRTGYSPPNFLASSIGGTVDDGSAIWTNIGTSNLDIPIGGTVGNVTGRSYFTTARGFNSVEYLICLARAKLAYRARMVKIKADKLAFEQVIGLSCRMNATIVDGRIIAGGCATGKIIEYEIRVDGNRGLMDGFVTIGCTVGNGGPLILGEGQTALATEDVGYTRPSFVPFDDGISFPPSLSQIAVVNTLHGSTANELAAAEVFLAPQIAAGWLQSQGRLTVEEQIAIFRSQQSFETLVNGNQVWFDLQILPVAGNTFSGNYVITVTKFHPAKTIDLSAGFVSALYQQIPAPVQTASVSH